jgi:hypothetical protein
MFDSSYAAAIGVLARSRRKLRAVLDSFDGEILLCDCADGAVNCDGVPVD